MTKFNRNSTSLKLKMVSVFLGLVFLAASISLAEGMMCQVKRVISPERTKIGKDCLASNPMDVTKRPRLQLNKTLEDLDFDDNVIGITRIKKLGFVPPFIELK